MLIRSLRASSRVVAPICRPQARLTRVPVRLCSSGPSPPAADPSKKKLLALGVVTAIPMVGFGFVDNFIMIVAGDAIDASLGAKFGISTLAAAGLGNLISDVAGVGIGDMIENAVARVGLKMPAFSSLEAAALSTRVVKTSSSIFGISLGCLLGMCPLLFMNSRKDVYFEHYELALHKNHFAQVGMEQYFRLMRIAKWHSVDSGAPIVKPGPLNRVIILHEGQAKSIGKSPQFVYNSQNDKNNSIDPAVQPRGCVIGGTALVDRAVTRLAYPNEVRTCSPAMYVEFKLPELREMMDEDTAIAAAVYHCLFKDRVKQKKERKVSQEREHVLGEYQTLLRAILADGFVHPQEREVCTSWRAAHKQVTDSDHDKLLLTLGWTRDQWDKGAVFDQAHL